MFTRAKRPKLAANRISFPLTKKQARQTKYFSLITLSSLLFRKSLVAERASFLEFSAIADCKYKNFLKLTISTFTVQ